jgi:hypothetical protein
VVVWRTCAAENCRKEVDIQYCCMHDMVADALTKAEQLFHRREVIRSLLAQSKMTGHLSNELLRLACRTLH